MIHVQHHSFSLAGTLELFSTLPAFEKMRRVKYHPPLHFALPVDSSITPHQPHGPSRQTPAHSFRPSPLHDRHAARCHRGSSPLACPAPAAGSPASKAVLHTRGRTPP